MTVDGNKEQNQMMNTYNIKISIIIPIYNCEAYIEECLESVIKQSCKELEILCIDDGSTDSSADIIEELVKKDSRIMLLRQENQGAGKARNMGMKHARGKYLAFLDADDYYSDNEALQSMYDLCEEKEVDICGSYSIKMQPDGSTKNVCLYGTELPANNIYNYSDYQFDYGYVLFIYRKKLLEEHNIVFPSYRRFQDPPFMVKAMFAAGQFTCVDRYLYCCRVSNSIKKFNAAKTVDLLNALMDNMQFAKEHHLDILWEKTLERLEYEYASLIVHSMDKDNSTILQLLIRANEMVSRAIQDETYTIRPLRLMIEAASEWNYREYLEKLLDKTDKLVIYGAGMMGQAFLKYLLENHRWEQVQCFLVTSLSGNLNKIQDIPVFSLDQYIKMGLGGNELIVAAVDGCNQKEVERTLLDNGFENVELLDTVFLSELNS
ncbi:MAG: glycosyltransferase family 2 protein [Ruminococcus flavefaciens]|nr:glycosyltransferase family 2 protein [Ruminococcus flavefaciens]